MSVVLGRRWCGVFEHVCLVFLVVQVVPQSVSGSASDTACHLDCTEKVGRRGCRQAVAASPRYVYGEIARMTFGGAEAVAQLEDYLTKKLQKDDARVRGWQ